MTKDRPTGLHNDESKLTPLTAPSTRDAFDYPQDYRAWINHVRANGGTIPSGTEPWPIDHLATERVLYKTLAARYAHGYQED